MDRVLKDHILYGGGKLWVTNGIWVEFKGLLHNILLRKTERKEVVF